MDEFYEDGPWCNECGEPMTYVEAAFYGTTCKECRDDGAVLVVCAAQARLRSVLHG